MGQGGWALQKRYKIDTKANEYVDTLLPLMRYRIGLYLRLGCLACHRVYCVSNFEMSKFEKLNNEDVARAAWKTTRQMSQ